MDVISATQTTGQTASPAKPQEKPEGLGADFETFLKMLTTQLKNQDPLNPMESSEFAVQLATFSGVEQQVRSNELLTSLISQQQLGGLGQSASWIGMEVRSAAPASFSGQPVTLLPKVEPDATRAVLVVTNAAGEEVQRQQIGLNSDPYDWQGRSSDGTPLPDGVYSFQVESYVDGELKETHVPERYARVAEVRMGESGAEAVLDSGQTIPVSEVTALRQPDAG